MSVYIMQLLLLYMKWKEMTMIYYMVPTKQIGKIGETGLSGQKMSHNSQFGFFKAQNLGNTLFTLTPSYS